jgi:hypothetical protein
MIITVTFEVWSPGTIPDANVCNHIITTASLQPFEPRPEEFLKVTRAFQLLPIKAAGKNIISG